MTDDQAERLIAALGRIEALLMCAPVVPLKPGGRWIGQTWQPDRIPLVPPVRTAQSVPASDNVATWG